MSSEYKSQSLLQQFNTSTIKELSYLACQDL